MTNNFLDRMYVCAITDHNAGSLRSFNIHLEFHNSDNDVDENAK